MITSTQGEPYAIKAGDTIEFTRVRAPEHTPMTSYKEPVVTPGKRSPLTEEGAKTVALILEQMEEKRERQQREKECIEVQQREARRQAAQAAAERQRRIAAASKRSYSSGSLGDRYYDDYYEDRYEYYKYNP